MGFCSSTASSPSSPSIAPWVFVLQRQLRHLFWVGFVDHYREWRCRPMVEEIARSCSCEETKASRSFRSGPQPEELLKVGDSEEFRTVGDPRSAEIWRCASEEKIVGSVVVIVIVIGGGQELEGPSSRDLVSPSSDAVASSRSASSPEMDAVAGICKGRERGNRSL
ncbi:hypothetical protein TIFTF001_007254 [Ficus carica]|uniref:Uncharacterized protein n=1 Tax=Ficus carica TaxID=3494 RepID=A0AA87ZRC4_FICCA|nr:hypothetical protein TIFTF001_007254 [Ficus carica]